MWTSWCWRCFRSNTTKPSWLPPVTRLKNSSINAIKKYDGKFICVVEGAVGTKFDGGYGKVGGRTFLEIAKEVCPKAAAVIAYGTCATFGGIQAAAPNPGGYQGCW
jgi:Ni,Fe-hydrogenase I small subunit